MLGLKNLNTKLFSEPQDFTGLDSFLVTANAATTAPHEIELEGFSAYSNGPVTAWRNVPALNPFLGMLMGAEFGADGTLVSTKASDDAGGFEPLDRKEGTFWLIEKHSAGLRISSDPFGRGLLFHGEVAGQPVLSNRLLLIAEYAKARGVRMQPNIGAILLQTYADTSIAQHSVVRHTVFEGVHYAAPKEYFYLPAGGKLTQQATHQERRIFTMRQYKAALENCANQTTRRIEALGAGFDQISVALTAGVDSRGVLAAVLGSSQKEKIVVRTNPNVPIDSYGSHVIREKYGLSLHSDFSGTVPFDQTETPAKIRQALTRSFGTSHEIVPRVGLADYLAPMLFVGGGGEETAYSPLTSRNTAPGSHQFGYTYDSSVDFVRKYAGDTWSTTAVSAMAHSLHEEMQQLPGDTLFEKLDMHYNTHLVRFHFRGNERWNESSRISYQPLMSGELFDLSRRVTRIYRVSASVLPDLSEVFFPGITETPYNQALAKESGITFPKNARGVVTSKYDIVVPQLIKDDMRNRKKEYEDQYWALFLQADKIVSHVEEFSEMHAYGVRRAIGCA